MEPARMKQICVFQWKDQGEMRQSMQFLSAEIPSLPSLPSITASLETLTAHTRLPYKEGGYNRPSQGSNEGREISRLRPFARKRRRAAES